MFDYTKLWCNAITAYNNSTSEWAKSYWLEVASKLAQNADKQ